MSCGRKIWKAPDPNSRDAELTAIVDAHTSVGAVVRVQTPQGDWVYAVGEGIDRADRFGVRDITAAYVATAVLILADANTVRLDDPVSKYVPNVPHGDEITVRHLLAMKSGLADYRSTPDPEGEVTAFALLEKVSPDLGFAPGTAFEYSRTNALVLGEVIFAATGKDWFDFVRERMLEPLKLFRTELPGAAPSEPFAKPGDANHVHYSVFGAASGIATTVEELSTFGRALAEGAYLSAFLQSQRLGIGEEGYGLGIAEVSGLLGHSGDGDGYSAAVYHEPVSDMTLTVLLNGSADDATATVVDLAKAMGWPPE